MLFDIIVWMNKNLKQIYVTLQIDENDIKILIAEYFNSRFNVIKVGRLSSKSISNFVIIDKELFKTDLQNLLSATASKIGAKIEKAILVLPAYNFRRIPVKISVKTTDGYLRKQDVAREVKNCLKFKVDDDLLIINTLITKYTINGLSSRRMPENEPCEEALLDVDLLCGDCQTAYDYVSAVEATGLKVLDITLNNYAIACEASLIEESLKQNVILFDISRNYTFLTLLSKGKLVSTEIVYDGIDRIVRYVKGAYSINDADIVRMVKYELNFESNSLDDVIYAYSDTNSTRTITVGDLNNLCLQPIEEMSDQLVSMCKPILNESATLFVTGQGQQVKSLINKIEQKSQCELKSYYPDTIGVRDPELTALYGALFVYRDKVLLNDLNVNCIDLLEYDSLIDQKQLDTDGQTITTKIKNLFKQYMEKEN